MSNVNVTGLDSLYRILRAVSANADDIVERGMLKAGNKVRNKAVMLCPVKTGALRNSIQVEQPAHLTVTVGTNLEYAPFVEYGTGTMGDPAVPHTDKENWRYKDEDGNWHTAHGQPAQPFLRPAVDAEEITQTIKEEIERGIADAGH